MAISIQRLNRCWVFLILISCLPAVTSHAQRLAEDRLYAGQYSPNGAMIAFAGFRTIEIYTNILDHLETLSISAENVNGINAELVPLKLSWSPDGSKLATSISILAGDAAYSKIAIWDTQTWEHLHDLQNAGSPFAWSGDSQMLAANGYRRVSIFSIETGRTLHEFSPDNGSNITELAWNPGDLNQLLIGTNSALEVWDFDTQISTIPMQYRNSSRVAYNPDGSQFAVTDWNEIQVWDSASLTLSSILSAHTEGIEVLFWIEAGLVSATHGEGQTMYLWESNSNLPRQLTHNGHITTAISPDASTYIVGTDNGKMVFATNTGCLVDTLYYSQETQDDINQPCNETDD